MIFTCNRKQRSVRVCKRKLEDYERTPEEEEDGHPLQNSDSSSGDDSVVPEGIKNNNEDIEDGSLKSKETKRKRLIEGNEQLNVNLDGMECLLNLANATVEEGENEKKKEKEIESCPDHNDSMSLSNPYKAGSSSQSYYFPGSQEGRSHLATSPERIPTIVHMKPTLDEGLYKCKGCNKTFTSHQALGGHRASHKNVKGCYAAKAENSEESSQEDEEDGQVNPDSEGRVEKLHECTICDRKFLTGQALGGHKRCHWISRTLSTELIEENIQHQQQHQQLTTKEIALKKLKEFDLNFPTISELVSSSFPTSPPMPNYLHQLPGRRTNLNISNNDIDINVESHNVIEGGSRVGDSEVEERRQSETSNKSSVEDDDTMTLLTLGCARTK